MIPLCRPIIDERDIAAVTEVLRSGWLTGGPKVEAFEQALCDYTGAKYAVCCSSGTMALTLACEAVDVRGLDVYTTPLTFAATASAPARVGCRSVKFVDVEAGTYCLQPGHYRGVVIPVDYAGLPCQYDKISGMAVIADAAHSLGASYKGRKVGTLADVTCFSFHPTKSITTGEGGAALTDDRDLAVHMRRLRDQGLVRSEHYYSHVELGYNGRMSEIAAALGLSQLERLDANVKRRRALRKLYTELLPDGVEWQIRARYSSAHLMPVVLPHGFSRHDVAVELLEAGIQTNVHYRLLNWMPHFRDENVLPNADHFALHCLSLPLYPELQENVVVRICEALRDILERRR